MADPVPADDPPLRGPTSLRGLRVRLANLARLQHPLSVDLYIEKTLSGARGILINITGGDDLSLFEINEALTHLHTQTSPETEIVMGIVRDDSMNDRAEVFMIVTGLGAQTLEDVLPGAERITTPKPVAQTHSALLPIEQTPGLESRLQTNSPALPTGNLDLPAFLRRDRQIRRFGPSSAG